MTQKLLSPSTFTNLLLQNSWHHQLHQQTRQHTSIAIKVLVLGSSVFDHRQSFFKEPASLNVHYFSIVCINWAPAYVRLLDICSRIILIPKKNRKRNTFVEMFYCLNQPLIFGKFYCRKRSGTSFQAYSRLRNNYQVNPTPQQKIST